MTLSFQQVKQYFQQVAAVAATVTTTTTTTTAASPWRALKVYLGIRGFIDVLIYR